MFSALWKCFSFSSINRSCYTSGGIIENLKEPLLLLRRLNLPCTGVSHVKNLYRIIIYHNALGLLNPYLTAFGICPVYSSMQYVFRFGSRSLHDPSSSQITSHILILFLSEWNPPVANEHLFAWIRYERGATVSIA